MGIAVYGSGVITGQTFAVQPTSVVTFVNATTTGFLGPGTSVSLAATSLTAGNLILVCVGSTAAINSVTDTAGNTYARALTVSSPVSWTHVEVWFANNVTGNASNVVTANLAASSSAVMSSAQYSGADKSNPLDTVTAIGHASATTSVTSGSFTPNGTGETAVAMTTVGGNGETWTAGTSYTARGGTTSVTSAVEDRANAPVSSQTAVFTWGASDNCDMGVVLVRPGGEATVVGGGYIRRWVPQPVEFSPVFIPWTQAIPVSLPDSFLRRQWNPERSVTVFPVQFVPATRPVYSMLPEQFIRPIWNPDRSYKIQPALNTVIVPASPVPPVLPPRFARPIWNPERSLNVFPAGTGVPPSLNINISAPPTVEINERFLVKVTASVSGLAGGGGGIFIPILVADLEPSSSPETMVFGTVYLKDIAGFGYMTIGTQPVILQIGSNQSVFYYEAVGFIPGTYTLSATMIAKNGTYYQTGNQASVVVTGP